MLRGRPAILLKVLAVLAPLLLIFWQDLEVVANDALNSEVMNYIVVIPFFIAYALYRKRKMLKAVTHMENPEVIRNAEIAVGASLLLAAFVLYWQGSYTFYPVEYHLISMPIFLAGAILMTYNWQTVRQLLFPLSLLLLLEPLPLQLADVYGSQISTMSSMAAFNLLRLFSLPVSLTMQQTPVINIETVQGGELPLAVDVACSGLYSLTGFATFAVFAAFIMRGPPWKRTALFAAGFPIIYGLNILRIASIVWIAHWWGEGTAMGAFHLLGGSALIVVAVLLLLTIGDRIGRLSIFAPSASPEPCSLCNDSIKEGDSFCPYCGKFHKLGQQKVPRQHAARILGVLVIALLVVPIQIPPYALAKGTASIDLGTFSPVEIMDKILPTMQGWDLGFLYRDSSVERIAKWDAALVYYYRKQGSDEFQPTIFVLIQVEEVRHSWEASLYEWPAQHGNPTATMLAQRDINILDNPRITGRFLEFMRVGSTVPEAIIYWFEKALFTVNGTVESRYVSISLDASPDDLVRAGFVSGPNDADGIQAALLPMARSIAEHWEPLKTWTLIRVSLGGLSVYVLILIASLCAVVIALLFFRLRAGKRHNAGLYRRLTNPLEMGVLDAIAARSGNHLMTAKTIKAQYDAAEGGDIEPKALVLYLKDAEKTGLVKRGLKNYQDEPILVWENTF